jgi:hypothetical protein
MTGLVNGRNGACGTPLYVAFSVARGLIEVDDPGIQGMRRIEFAEYRAVQPLIWADSSEFRAAENGFSRSVTSTRTPTPMSSSAQPSARSLSWIFQTTHRRDCHEMGRLVKTVPGQFNKVCGASAWSSAIGWLRAAGFGTRPPMPKSAPPRTFPLRRMPAQPTRRRDGLRQPAGRWLAKGG